jgi:saccharopine dehydrogenase-like NADP-dependent oxidoreductase
MQADKNILILGSGMMVEPLIDILLRRDNNKITLASNMYETLKLLIDKRKNPNLRGQELDVLSEKLLTLVSEHDIVISYVPAAFHPVVAKACLAAKRNLVTASYVFDEMKAMNKEVIANNLIFMNEIGLDPGIDHLLTYKVLLDAKAKGEKIISYESWCGALCSPEYINNPMLYKFSWSPKGALMALRNTAKQFINGKTVTIPSDKLLIETTDKVFHPCFKFEGYYNRDSLNYKELYHLKDAKNVIRGTIRFEGFSFIFQCFKNLGFFADTKYGKDKTWKSYLQIYIDTNKMKLSNAYDKYNKFVKSDFFMNNNKDLKPEDCKLYLDTCLLAIGMFEEKYVEKRGFNDLLNKIFSTLQYLELVDESKRLKDDSIFESFALLLQDKLVMTSGERDLVFMQNEFLIETKEGKLKRRKFDLLAFGGHNGLPYSATALLVSLPCAVTTQVNFI